MRAFTDEEERAAWAAVLAEYEALRAEVVRLRGKLEVGRFRPMTERPAENGQACEVILNASYIHSNHPDDEGAPGYWIGERYAGKGLMLEGLQLLVGHAFQTLRLHRVEAACIPDNRRSIRVLEKAGFQREGLLRSYLRINGVWQDHLLFGLLHEDFRG